LATNELKGKRVNNQYGVSEWRVWPNRDIEEKAKAIGLFDELSSDSPSEEFQGGDSSAVLEAETMEVDGAYFEEAQAPVMTIIREMSQQFAEQLSKEKQLNFQLQREIDDKDRQLKLLPDFQKQAEERRLEAEAKELEANALAKQIAAMQERAEQAVADVARLSRLETEILPTLEGQLAQERLQKERDLAEASAKLAALENAKREAEEAKSKLEASLQSEIDRLREEKEEQSRAIETKFESLHQKLEQLQKPEKPWWKKVFGES
jgi:chromosome segregation ATPase